jgi:hypothetical protein
LAYVSVIVLLLAEKAHSCVKTAEIAESPPIGSSHCPAALAIESFFSVILSPMAPLISFHDGRSMSVSLGEIYSPTFFAIPSSHSPPTANANFSVCFQLEFDNPISFFPLQFTCSDKKILYFDSKMTYFVGEIHKRSFN